MEHLKGFTKGFESLSAGVFGSMGSALGIYSQKQPEQEVKASPPKNRNNIEYVDDMGNEDVSFPRLYPDIDEEFVNSDNPPAMQPFQHNNYNNNNSNYNNNHHSATTAVAVQHHKHSNNVFVHSTLSDSDEEEEFLLIEHPKIAPNCNFYYLPFVQSVDLCHRLIQNWLQQIWFLPSDWRVSLKILPPKPHYVPFFVFNVETSTRYEASVLVESKDPGSPGKRWEPAVGEFTSHYDEIITCASWSVNLDLVSKLLDDSTTKGFSFHSNRALPVVERLREFDESTFQGDEPILPLEMSKEEAWEHYGRLRVYEWEERKARELLMQNYELTTSTSSQIRGLRVDPTFATSSCFVILLPIYFTGVEYANSKFEILVSGNRGQVVGNRPHGTGSGGKYILDKLKAVGTLVSDTIPL